MLSSFIYCCVGDEQKNFPDVSPKSETSNSENPIDKKNLVDLLMIYDSDSDSDNTT